MSQAMEGISYKDIQKISRSFRDVACRLLRTKRKDAVYNLKRFIDFIDNNHVTCIFILSQIEESGVTFSETDLETNLLPVDLAEEVNFTYSKLKNFIESGELNQIDYFDLAWNYICNTGMPSSNKFQDCVDEFNERVVLPFVNHILNYLSDLQIDLSNPPESKVLNNLGTINHISGDNIQAIQGNGNQGAIGKWDG